MGWRYVMSTEWQEWRKECTAIEEAMSRLLMRGDPTANRNVQFDEYNSSL